MGNLERAARLIRQVRAAGVTEFCVCAGSRNSPLLAVLGESDAALFSFVDERSAAFFALGRIKLHGNPVAVVTTSGTAIAETFPAAIEAHYSGLALVLISADRPARYRGTGAPQSIEQEGIFGVYAETDLSLWTGNRALHINIEFDEPLLDGDVSEAVRVGAVDDDVALTQDEGLSSPDASRRPSLLTRLQVLRQLLGRLQRPPHPPLAPSPPRKPGGEGSRWGEVAIRSESSPRPNRYNRDPSPLRRGEKVPKADEGSPSSRNRKPSAQQESWFWSRTQRPLVLLGGLAPQHRARVKEFALELNAPVYAEALSGLREDPDLPLLTAGERLLARGRFDAVIRIGNVPALRFWRDLEETLPIPVAHYSDLPFAGLTRGEVQPIAALPNGLRRDGNPELLAEDRAFAEAIGAILEGEPKSELAMMRALSLSLPQRSRVYLGNSLPIREWDLVASRETRGFEYEANRGANGIDGQLSTFLGWCAPDRANVCVLGDLTTLYDLGAPWIARQLDADFRIVVVNNGGGRIFGRVASLRTLPPELRARIIENVHEIRFDSWAKMWGIDVTELRPDEEASHRVWQKYDELWA